MAAAFDAAIGFDSSDYTFDGTFIGVAPGGSGLFLAVALAGRNTSGLLAANCAGAASSNTVDAQGTDLSYSASNVWS